MGLFDRLATGWSLAMDSLDVLREHPDLAAFPLLGGLAGTVYVGLLAGGSAVGGLGDGAAVYAVLFVLYLGSAFLAAFFTAGLTYSVREAFEGREPSLRSGLAAAWRKRRLLFAWAVLSAVVGMLLRTIERRNSLVTDVVAGLFGVAWGILTYFVVPVIVFEDVSAGTMLRRSGETFRDTWGETAGAGFGVGLVTVLFTLVGLAAAVLVFVALGATPLGFLGSVVLAVLVMFAAALLGSTLGGIAKTALYVYATEGTQPAAFDDVDFRETVR